MADSIGEITQLLRRVRNKQDKEAWVELYGRIERHLFQAARALRGRFSPHRTFQTTELVNEAFAKLLECDDKEWVDRRHYIRTAIIVMKNKILDHARKRKPAMLNSDDLSGLGASSGGPEAAVCHAELLVQLDAALQKLFDDDPDACDVFVVRYFGACRFHCEQSVSELLSLPQAGELLTYEQVGEILDVPRSTVEFRWKKARLYLAREFKRNGVYAAVLT